MTTRSGGPPLYRPLVILVVCVLLKVKAQESSCYQEWKQCVDGEIGKQTSPYLCDLIFLAFGECAKPLTCQEDLALQFSQLIGDYSCANTDQESTTPSTCSTTPCQNGATCVVDNNKALCLCKFGYNGEFCQNKAQEGCETNPCQNGGLCQEGTNGYNCICQGRFKGTNCEIRPDLFERVTRPFTTVPTTPTTPYAGCTCINGYCSSNGYCVCYEGFTGQDCRTTTVTPTPVDFVTSAADGALECSRRMQGCSKPLTDFASTGNTTNIQKLCSLSFESIKCMENHEIFCSQYMNMSDSIQQAKQSLNTTCSGQGQQCMLLTSQCTATSVEASKLITSLQQKGEGITEYLGLICGLLNQTVNCLDRSFQNTSGDCRNMLEMTKNATKTSYDMLCNKCYYNPCMNGGSCIDLTTDYTCICSSPYYGKMCEFNKEIDAPCGSGFCQHGGWCGQNDVCQCSPGYEGLYCEYKPTPTTPTPTWNTTTIDPYNMCQVKVCFNGGTCLQSGYCTCPDDFMGSQCQYPVYNGTTSTPVSMCNGGYCQNGASCWASSNTEYCNCLQGFTGKYCENQIVTPPKECDCKHYGSCSNGQCYCMGNWVGTHCEEYNATCNEGVEKVECFINPCVGQTCAGNPSAECVPNYCGECGYMFVDEYGYNTSCSGPVDESPTSVCMTELVDCTNEAMMNHTVYDLANPDMYCSLNRRVMDCYDNLNDVCSSLSATMNSSKQLMDSICGPDGMPLCYRTLLECSNSSLTTIGSFLQHPSSSMSNSGYCSMLNETMNCVERHNYMYNSSDCPSLLLTQIENMTASYDSLCGDHGTCDTYNCNNGTCYDSYGFGRPYCACDSGYYGDFCDVNVCDYFDDNPCGVGNCTGEVEMGNLCTCPYYREGVLCEVNDYESTFRTCPRRKRLGKYILDIIEGQKQAPTQLNVPITSIFRALNSSWFQIPDCTSDGEYSGRMTEFDVFNPSSRNYYCVDKYGFRPDSSVDSSIPPNCAALNGNACESSPCVNGGTCQDYYLGVTNHFTCNCPPGYYGKHCEIRMCSSFQMDPCSLNGGKCLGDINTGRLCTCPDGRMGPLCDHFGDDSNKTECQRLRELTVEVERFLNGSRSLGFVNVRDMILSATNSINLTSMFLPICDDNGQPTNIECDVDIKNTSQKACYCLNQRGQRDSPPHYDGLPNCTRNHTGPCPPGVQIYACLKDPCEVNKCQDYPYAYCKANYCGGCNAEFYINTTRINCTVPDTDVCPPGVPMVMCFANPCDVTRCPRYPQAMCRSNYCGGCNADFFMNGMKVQCRDHKQDLSWDPPRIVFQSKRSIYFKVGEQVTLRCNTTGHNFSNVWYKDGVKVDYGFPGQLNYKRVVLKNGSLVIINPNYTDEGHYQCRYGPVVGDYITLREAKIPYSYNGHQTLRVSLGTSLKLECNLGSSTPPAEVNWILEHENGPTKELNLTKRITMDYEGNLYFVNVQLEDAAPGYKYVCIARNEPARLTNVINSYTITLADRTAPMARFDNSLMWGSTTNQKAFLGEEFRLKCIFSGYPAPFVSFRRLNESRRYNTPPQSSYYQNELVIKNVTMKDAGEYECYANTEGSNNVSARISYVQVAAKPYFMEPPRDQEIMPGGNAVFKCHAEGIPTPTIQWYINGTSLQSINRTLYIHGYFAETVQRNTLLILRHMKVYRDHLVVQCNVSNMYGYLWNNMALSFKVENKTSLHNTTRPGRCPPVMNGTMAIGIEECMVDTDCQQDPSLKCCFNGFRHRCMMPIRNDTHATRPGRCPPVMNGTMAIGIEECTVDTDCQQDPSLKCCFNGFGHQCMMPFTKRDAPVIVAQSPAMVYFTSNLPSSLYCKAEGEKLTYTWYKDGKYFNFTDPRYLYRVIHNHGTIRNSETLKILDEGVYQCEVSNENGTAIGRKIELKLASFDNFNGGEAVNKMVDIGAALTLYCNMPQSEPKAKITWILMNSSISRYAGSKNFSIVNLSRRITMDNDGNLHFVNVRASDVVDGKSYICMGYNSFAGIRRYTTYYTLTSNFNDAVPRAADLQWASPGEPTGIMGDEFSLKCIFSGYPTPEVEFERIDGKPLSGYVMKKSFGLELYFPSLDITDAGTYRCFTKARQIRKKRATNIMTFNVAVESKPYYDVPPKDIKAYENEDAVFLCRADGIPKPNITWYINGDMVLVITERFHVTGLNNEVLRIDKVRMSDKFVIQCNASNTHGSLLNNLYLQVKPKPTARPGRCPPVMNGTMAIGIEECTVDTDCHQDPSLKCCSNGFGHQCMMPIRNETHENCYSLMGQCLNGGTCWPRNGSMAYCECPRRYIGDRCQTWRKLPCDSYPCQNGASCQDLSEDMYSCSCPGSWGLNCERPTHDNCTCSYKEKCVLKENCEIENGRYYNCIVTKQCLLNSVYDPCIATTCPKNSECYIDVNSKGRCSCRKGFSGTDCSINDEVCNRFMNVSTCAVYWKGNCVGDLENGVMCSCSNGTTGPFCEDAGSGLEKSKCEKKKEFYDRVLNEDSPRIQVILEMMNSSWIPMVNCTPEGNFAPKQCFQKLSYYDNYTETYCKCVNGRGDVLSDVKTYPGHDSCTVPDSRTETARRICSTPMANDLCWNGGRCKGDIFNGRICECSLGYSGVFCHKRGNEEVDEQSLCELNRQAFQLITQFTNSSGNYSDYNLTRHHNVDETARRFLSILEFILRDPMRLIFNDSLVPMANCTRNGDFTPVQCVYNVTDMSVDACYCAMRNGTAIPGSRVMSPYRPTCERDVISCDGLESCSLRCENGYQHDMSGCAICACKSPCAGKVCSGGNTCHVQKRQNCTLGTGPCHTSVCVPDDKVGQCPNYQHSNMIDIINKYLSNYECTNECRNDSDCSDDKVCCGMSCGSQCMKPLGKGMCRNDKMKMKQEMELFKNIQMVLRNQTALQSFEPLMVDMMRSYVSREIRWKPECIDDNTYQREQCYFNFTGVNRPVYCQCMSSNGIVVNNTRSTVDNSTMSLFNCQEKPGICPNVQNDTFGIAVEMCSNDYECQGLEKCCSNGAGHVCKHVALEGSGDSVMNVICRYQENLCQSVDKNASCIGDWENGNLCQCREKSGLLCKKPYSERKMTRCQQQEKLYSILYNVTHMKSVEPGYNEIVNFVKALQLLQAPNHTNLAFTSPKCHMTDGSYRNYQCDQYLFSNKTKECYCVNERGHKFLGSEFRPDQESKCIGYENPDTECRIGSPLGNGTKYVQCNAYYPCPHGYECNLGRVYTSNGGYNTNGYCCLKHTALENRCNITVDKGVREQQCPMTKYYFNSGLQKCVEYNSSKCDDGHKVNSFYSQQECDGHCLKNIKSGSCPRKPPMYAQTKNCQNQCQEDGDCSGDYKCCETSCAKRCILAEADEMQKDKPCSSGVNPLQDFNCGRGGERCPDGYYCDIAPNDAYAACCPDKPQDICSMEKDTGPCKAYFPRWYFNSQTRQCEEFIYGGCSGNNNNFMTKQECCNSCGADVCKEGQCPSTIKSIYASCDIKCKTDSDCEHGSLCCSNGCGKQCVTPTKNDHSSCFRELEMANLKLSNKLTGQCSTLMVPRCNMDGSWNPEQCMDNYGLCWCVMRNGTKIPDTTISGRAQCGFTPKPGSGVPDPVYMRMESCSNTEAKLLWESPMNDNGYPVEQYLVQYRVRDDLDEWYTKELSPYTLGTIIKLYPGMKYWFRVQARNRIGLSKIVNQNIECETQPGRPLMNPTNITSITNKPGYLIVTWAPVPILYQGEHANFEYIVTAYQGDDRQQQSVQRFHKDSPLVFEMPTQQVFSNFTVQIRSGNSLGEAPMEALSHQVKSFEDTPLIVPEILSVSNIVHNSAMVSWKPVNPDDKMIQGVFRGFQVQYWRNDQGFRDMVRINVTSGNNLNLNDLLPNTAYKVQVAVRNTHFLSQASPEIRFTTYEEPVDSPAVTNVTLPTMPTDDKRDDINICLDGESIHCCSADLCKMSVCPAHPSAVCRVNPCGGCSVVFYDYDNSVVNCTKGLSMCEKRRHAAVKARYQHAFNNMTNIYPIVVVGNKTIQTTMQSTPTDAMSGNDSVCNLPPVSGMCRAYFPRWYFDPATALCQKFIYGGCGGNANSFDRPEDCYKQCSPEDNPCMNMEIPCADNEVCQIVTDPDCYTGACRQVPQCVKQHADPHITGVYVPKCNNDHNYEYKQCHHGYCWCVTKDGEIFTRSVTRGSLSCSETGPVADPQFVQEVCTNDAAMNMKCLDVCQDKLCPGYPDATCSVDLCTTDCKVKFVDKTNHEVACGNDICQVISAQPHKDCVAPVVCPGEETPKICPVDVCEKASCNGNPCALCSVDPCTCKPVFVDIISNITITDCSTIYTMCRMEYCNQLKDKNRAKSMGQDSDFIVLPACDSTGRYDSKQCDSDTCWCVNGKGQWTKDLQTAQDTCFRNETFEVTVQMKFQHNFSEVENNLEEFEQAVLELMKKWNLDQNVKSITISVGSVIAEIKFGSEESEQPAPILNLIPDIVQNRVKQQEAVIEWKGETWTADPDYFQVNTKYEKQMGESPESPNGPIPTPEDSGMDDKLIIVISVICGVFGAAIIAVVVWACCCRKPMKKEVKDTFFSDMNSDRSTPPPPFGVTNQTYMTNNMISNNMISNGDQYIDIKPTLHTFGDHNKPVEEEDYANDVIKVKL